MKPPAQAIPLIKSGVLGQAFKEGDSNIRGLVLHAAEYLGISMANLVNILNPEIIVLGGDLVEAMPKEFVEAAANSMRRHAMTFPVAKVEVVAAELADDATVYGAAKLIAEELAKNNEK